MKNPLFAISTAVMMTLSAGAYAADEKKDEFESSTSTKSTTSGGTVNTYEKNVDVDVDDKGRVNKTTTTEKSVNPEGLLNTMKDTSTTEYEEKARGGYKQTTTTKHVDPDGANVMIKTVTNVDVDADGKITTTAKSEKVVDPEGLMNSTTTTSKTKTVDGVVVEEKKEIND